MGKKGKSVGGNLGKALIRDRFGPTRFKRNSDSSMLHTSEINDGYDWGRLNLQSVTEESSFQEFLSTAELAGTEFHAEKLNIKFINPKSAIGLLSTEEKQKLIESQKRNKDLLKIPRRPTWDNLTTPEELHTKEKETFLEWRRSLATLQEVEELMLTPYEKNLEFWRQLWRVVEKSDVIVQIVDGRNPLLFRCGDLEKYVKEVDPNKMNMVLINKADFLTDAQRQTWAKYFSDINVKVAFFSAMLASETQMTSETIKEEDESEDEGTDDEDEEENAGEDSNSEESLYNSEFASESEYESANEGPKTANEMQSTKEQDKVMKPREDTERTCNDKDAYDTAELKLSIDKVAEQNTVGNETEEIENSPELLTREQLIAFFKTIYKSRTYMEGVTTIGLVGYPNVGKSSTINALLMDKKVSVSATPGKTKHFQTLYLDKDLLLCDCPGLVMPSFVSTKAEMILNGILPIDQMRDHVPPITLLGSLIPKHVIEDTYGMMIPPPMEGDDPDRPPTAEEILNAYGFNRGFMTQNGQPDNPRSSRYILKDFVNGKLLYCVAPPAVEQDEFHDFPPRRRNLPAMKDLPPRAVRASKANKVTSDDLDKTFFQSNNPGVHVRGKIGISTRQCNSETGSVLGSVQSLLNEEKPWKKINKHTNKKKREKTRRLYAHLDQH